MFRITPVFSFVSLAALFTAAAADDFPRFALSAQTNTLAFSNTDYGSKSLRNTTLVGARVFAARHFFIDGNVGFSYNSSVDQDTAALTSKDPGIRNVNGEIGAGYVLSPQNSSSYCAFEGLFGISRQQWQDYFTYRDSSRMYSEPIRNDYITYTVSQAYVVYIPYMNLSIEPGYCFDRHFSLFARFGLNAVWYPDSKFIDRRVPYNAYSGALTLSERNDGSFEFSVASVGLGVRYYF